MQETLNNINTSLEAHKLVKDPVKLLSLLYSKYGDIQEDYYISYINQILYKVSSHFNIQYKEIQYNDRFIEFFRRFYKKKEVKERIPNLYDYYKNYHLFYLKPILRNFYLENLMHNYQDKKAEIFYKNNYSQTSNEKKVSDDNSAVSSLSSSDHYTNNKIIFDSKAKLLLNGSNNNKSKKSLLNIEVSKIKKKDLNSNLRLSIKTSEESTLNEIMKELKKENKKKENNSKSKKKKTKTQRNSRKNHSPKIHSKSPTFQIKHQINAIKSTGNNINNNNYNLISPQMYILSQKNSCSKKKNHSHHIHKNKIYFSPKSNCYYNIALKFEEMFKKYPNYLIKVKNKRNKTGNNSSNNTIKKSINNNNININNNLFCNNNNFQSNFRKFAKLSSSLKNNRFNITYLSKIHSNNNSRNSMSGKKANKLQKNKNIMNDINQNHSNKNKKIKHKKNKTFDFNIAGGKYSELKKNYTNYNLLRFKPSPQNKFHSKNPIGLNINIMKSPKNDIILRNIQGSNNHSTKNKKIVNRKNNKMIKNNKKSFISISSCSSPKFSFIISKNEINIKDSLNNNYNNMDNNMYSFLNNNKKTKNKVKKSKMRKNNISYTNNNFNINFNNVFFCSSRPNSNQHTNNIISDNTNTNGNILINKNLNINNNCSINNINNLTSNNSMNLNNKKHNLIIGHKNAILNTKNNINNNFNINNLYIKSLNNIYNFSRNKNYKISNCSQTQTQSQLIAKNTKIIKISESKLLMNKTNSFIMQCNNKNIFDEKSINKIRKKNKKTKMISQIEDLILKSKKNNKFGSEHKNKIGTVISNKPTFNNKSKNQTQNKSNYHEMFIKNLKRTSSTSIKVNAKPSGNNQAINVLYKK